MYLVPPVVAFTWYGVAWLGSAGPRPQLAGIVAVGEPSGLEACSPILYFLTLSQIASPC